MSKRTPDWFDELPLEFIREAYAAYLLTKKVSPDTYTRLHQELDDFIIRTNLAGTLEVGTTTTVFSVKVTPKPITNDEIISFRVNLDKIYPNKETK